jgi:aspartate aminotransferase
MILEKHDQDNHPEKVNLGPGAYSTVEGLPLVLDAVRQAELELISAPGYEKEYSSPHGLGDDEEFVTAT